MSYVKLAKALIVALPEIIQLVKTLMEKYDEAQLDAKIKGDLKGISDAFKTKDAEALRRIFNS